MDVFKEAASFMENSKQISIEINHNRGVAINLHAYQRSMAEIRI